MYFNYVYLIIIVEFFCMGECTVGVDVRDGTTPVLKSILSNVVMGCIVLVRQMNVYFGTGCCIYAIRFVPCLVIFICIHF